MNNRMTAVLLGLGVLTCLTLSQVSAGPGAHGPDGEHLDAVASEDPGQLARLPGGAVNVPKAAQRRMGIRTVLAPESEAAVTVELAAKVIMDVNGSGRVQATYGGRIEAGPRGLPVTGQSVQQGEVLAYIRNLPDPYEQANQQAQLAELQLKLQLAETRARRMLELEGSVPRKEIEAAVAELESLQKTERRFKASVDAREPLAAPVTGVVSKSNVVIGEVVQDHDLLFEIIDPNRFLIEAVSADPEIATRIEAAHLLGTPDARLTLLGVGRALRDGVLPLTFQAVPAADGSVPVLAVGQPVTVIGVLKDRVDGIVLPADAIVQNTVNQSVVWIKISAERYLPQPIEFQYLDAQTVVVTHGLAAENRVVIRGAPLIAQIR